MKRSRSLATVACWIGLTALAAGCQTAGPDVRRPSVEMDPCAERLHDVCGQLLLYYSLNRRLPETLEALATLDPQNPLPLVCPVSDRPYLYHPDGLRIAGWMGRLVLYDATPSHSGMRWGVFLDDAGDGRNLIARVVLLPGDLVAPADKPSTSTTP